MNCCLHNVDEVSNLSVNGKAVMEVTPEEFIILSVPVVKK